MAEMTAAEAIGVLLKNPRVLTLTDRDNIAAMIERQAAEIERLSKRLEAAEKVCRAAEEYLIACGNVPNPEDESRGGRNQEWIDAVVVTNKKHDAMNSSLAEWKEVQKNGKS